MSARVVSPVARGRAAAAVMLMSGFAGLGLQIVWTQQNALWLGHEAAAVLAVVAAFFGGLALGAFALGKRIERSAHPARWYAGCELAIAFWSLLLLVAMPAASGVLARLTGVQPSAVWQWSVAFGGTFLLLLPATAAMGATLPAMERLTTQLRGDGRAIAPLYAANTFGAVLGVLATAFWLVPALGLARTAMLCVSLNAACAALTLYLLDAKITPAHDARPTPAARAALIRLACTGLLGIGYEVLVVRVLAQVAEDTVYTFALLLAVYLVGSAAGAAGYQHWLTRRADSGRRGDRLMCGLAAACVLGSLSLWAADEVKAGVLELSGAGMAAGLGAEASLAWLAFALPTFFMGAVFAHLAMRACAEGISFGRALAANTLGAAAAPFVFGVLAFPLLGPKFALLVVCGGYLALTRPRSFRTSPIWATAAAVAAVAIWAPPLAFIDVPAGGRVVSYREGVMASVSVVEDAAGVATLRIDNRQQEGSSATRRVDARQALLPLLLHPAPRHALFLGLGTGVTASSAALDPTLSVDAVELLPEVIAASAHFAFAPDTPPLHVIAADARRYVRASDEIYDVIVADNFHPARSGSAALYTVEHFRAIHARLAPDGLFCQWLPLHQLDLPTLRSIVHSFITVYPQGGALLASNSLDTPVIGLIARADRRRFDVDTLRRRLALARMTPSPASFGIEDEFALLGGFVAGPAALSTFAGDSVVNTDDRPIVAYRAPRITYAPDSLPRERLDALLRELDVEPRELVANAPDAQWLRRLGAYFAARDRFIAAGRNVTPSSDVRMMLAQVREPLLAVLHTSPDFRPAYDPLLMMGAALASSDADGARALLIELAAAQPERDEAQLALSAITQSSPEVHLVK